MEDNGDTSSNVWLAVKNTCSNTIKGIIPLTHIDSMNVGFFT